MLEARPAVRKLKQYQPPLGDRSGLRLDFNETPVDVSPHVIERLRQLQPTNWPVTRSANRGARGGVVPRLPTGAGAVDQRRGRSHSPVVRGVSGAAGPGAHRVPTFAMYQICAAATGARVISIPAEDDFRFPTAKVMAHTTAPKTRLIAMRIEQSDRRGRLP